MIMEGTLHPLGTVLRLWYRITEISEVWEGRDVCLLSPRWFLSADIGWRASNNVGPDVSEPPPGPCLSRSWHSGKPGQWSWRSELCHPQDLKGRCGRGVLEWVDPSCEERAMEKGGLREWGWVSAHFPRVQTCAPVLSLFSDVWLFNPVDCSPPDSCPWGFFRQEYWSGLWCPPPGDLPDPGIEPVSLTSTCTVSRVLYH